MFKNTNKPYASHIFTIHFPKTQFNIILPYISPSLKHILLFRKDGRKNKIMKDKERWRNGETG
jgi:hypothetical protein